MSLIVAFNQRVMKHIILKQKCACTCWLQFRGNESFLCFKHDRVSVCEHFI